MNRPVGRCTEPVRMLGDPGMIRRTLEGNIERELDALVRRGE